MRNLIFYIGLVAIFSSPAKAAEDYYIWIDENGVTNYAQRNPQGYNAEYVSRARSFGETFDPRRPGAPPIKDSAETNKPSTPTQTKSKPIDPDALVAEERAAMSAEIATTKRSNCEIGKKNLAQLQAFSRIRVQDKNGVDHILTESEKNDKMTEARQVIQENCSG